MTPHQLATQGCQGNYDQIVQVQLCNHNDILVQDRVQLGVMRHVQHCIWKYMYLWDRNGKFPMRLNQYKLVKDHKNFIGHSEKKQIPIILVNLVQAKKLFHTLQKFCIIFFEAT
jgi:hypothetical protein